MDIDEDADADGLARPQAECVRKEYRRLSMDEVRALHGAFNRVKTDGTLSMLIRNHRSTESPAAHFGPAFPGWHRLYLILYVLRVLSAYLIHDLLLLPISTIESIVS